MGGGSEVAGAAEADVGGGGAGGVFGVGGDAVAVAVGDVAEVGAAAHGAFAAGGGPWGLSRVAVRCPPNHRMDSGFYLALS